MNDSDSDSKTDKPSGKKLTAGGTLVGILVILYALLRPALSKQLGIDLPQIPINVADSGGSETTDRSQPDGNTPDEVHAPPQIAIPQPEPTAEKKAAKPMVELEVTPPDSRTSMPRESESKPVATEQENPQHSRSSVPANPQSSKQANSPGPLAGRVRGPPEDSNSETAEAPTSDPNLEFGILRSIGRDRFMSPAGLQYTPGSQEGHRLKHLERHTEDQPGRPGKHGVFDGGLEKTLQVLDQAYEKAKQGGHGVIKTEDDGRTIYTVDMGRRVGFVGGREGNRMRKPMARRVRIVLDGTRVITAYPL